MDALKVELRRLVVVVVVEEEEDEEEAATHAVGAFLKSVQQKSGNIFENERW